MSYKRKTYDAWEIHGNYGFGWECLCSEASWKDAKENIRLYRDNSPGSYKIVKKRVPIEQ